MNHGNEVYSNIQPEVSMSEEVRGSLQLCRLDLSKLQTSSDIGCIFLEYTSSFLYMYVITD